MDHFNDISDGELPRYLSGLGQTSTGKVFDDGAGTVTVLKAGTKAPRQIKQMQMLLNTFGYKLTVDGIFGAGSTAAVKAIQTKLSMSPTGIYDKALDERITGMNQSGVIDAQASDVKAVAAGEKTPQTSGGTTVALTPATPGQQGSGLVVAPVVNPVTGQLLVAPQQQGAMTPAQPFMTMLKQKWAQLQAMPNFKYIAAGVVVVAVGGVMVATMPKADSPRTSQMNGYRKSRKSRKSRR